MDITTLLDSRQREQAAWERRRPVCSVCDEHITDDHCYVINEQIICPACIDEARECTENLIDEGEVF
jgi:formylmethanofuran dehydrogenase subunit E